MLTKPPPPRSPLPPCWFRVSVDVRARNVMRNTSVPFCSRGDDIKPLSLLADAPRRAPAVPTQSADHVMIDENKHMFDPALLATWK